MITVDWLNEEHNIIVFSHIDAWTWAEFYTAHYQMERMLYQVPAPICVIADMSQQTTHPHDAVAHMVAISRNHHPNIGKLIIVAPFPQADDILQKILHVRPHLIPLYHHVYSFSEAIKACTRKFVTQ